MGKKSFGINLENEKENTFSDSQFKNEIEKKWGHFCLNTSQKFVKSML